MYAKGAFLRAPGNYDADAVSLETGLEIDGSIPEENLTQQQFKEECDINVILERFGQTGELPTSSRMPVSGDFTGVSDFQSAMQLVRQAEESFMGLPAKVRAEFGHDPQRVLEFLEDPANRDKAVELGLVEKPPEKTRDVVQAVDELAAALKPTTVVTPLGG